MSTQPHHQTADQGAPAPEMEKAFYGFVASEPKLTYHDGKPRLYFKAGQEHYRYGPDGSRTKLPTTFHDVVAFKGAAIHGGQKLAKLDWFMGLGHDKPNTNPATGVEEVEFIANRFGHDIARMNYEIDTPRRVSQLANQAEQNRSAGFNGPAVEQPSRDRAARTL
ncbi:hypothetical protein ACTXL6_15635 [Brachybacterium tyrofermentans]|uniref:hypothetical protein n=1 Tax=Brachybacterium tyrofermentans TaxID=47848 RepID=UPI003FD27BF1